MRKKEADSRDRYIALLSQAGGESSEVDHTAELIKEEYLEGVVRGSPAGTPSGTIVTGITVKGRLFLRDLKEQRKKESLRHRIFQAALVVGGFLAGHFADVAKEWLEKLIK